MELYWLLFWDSFFAHTLLPIHPDVVLNAMLAWGGFDPLRMVIFALLGGVLGLSVNALVMYGLASLAAQLLSEAKRVHYMALSKAFNQKYYWALIMLAFPFINTAIATLAGVARVRWWLFISAAMLMQLAYVLYRVYMS